MVGFRDADDRDPEGCDDEILAWRMEEFDGHAGGFSETEAAGTLAGLRPLTCRIAILSGAFPRWAP